MIYHVQGGNWEVRLLGRTREGRVVCKYTGYVLLDGMRSRPDVGLDYETLATLVAFWPQQLETNEHRTFIDKLAALDYWPAEGHTRYGAKVS